MTLPELAIRRPVTTLMILVSLFVIGTIALTKLPLAFMPESEDPQVWVIVPLGPVKESSRSATS